MSTYVQDFEFVLRELIRFAKMRPPDLRKLSFEDAFATIPTPKRRGMMICGAAANARLYSIAERAISQSGYDGRLDRQAVQVELKKSLVRRFVDRQTDLTRKTARSTVRSAIKAAAEKIEDRTHFVPCHIVLDADPDKFSIGPVTFVRRDVAFRGLESAFRAYLRRSEKHELQPPKGKRIGEMLSEDAREYYASFDWIARVKIRGCDPPSSERRADKSVQRALDCLHLFIGAGYSRYMRAGGSKPATDRKGKIEIRSNRQLLISTSNAWREHRLGPGWWAHLKREIGLDIIRSAGVALKLENAGPTYSALSTRFLDAAAWYGEAVRDPGPSARLIKYVTALERLLITKKVRGISRVLGERAAALAIPYDFKQVADDIEEIYGYRSALLHGSRSPFDRNWGSLLRKCESLTRLVILRFLGPIGSNGLLDETATDEKLDQFYGRLVLSRRPQSPQSKASPSPIPPQSPK